MGLGHLAIGVALPLFAESELRDGARVYRREIHAQIRVFGEAAFGEEFVMEACRPFLGCRLDSFDSWDLALQRFERNPEPRSQPPQTHPR
jgi:hypothetical protein